MIKKCQHCNKPNKGGWFTCKFCDRRAHPKMFTTNSWMRGKVSSRTDIEVNTMSLEESTSKMAGNTMNQKLKELGVQPL